MNSRRLYFVHLVFSLLPATRCFAVKRQLLRWAGAEVGTNVRIASSARFYMTGRLALGQDTWVGHEVLITGGDASVLIGSRVDIAPRVSLVTGSHMVFSVPNRAAGEGYSLPLVVSDGVWLGTGAIVLGGATLGECAIVAAGALVISDVDARSVVGGVPAKLISRR